VERDSRDIARMTLERDDSRGIRRSDIVKLDGVMSSCGEVSLIGRYAESVDLRLCVRDGPRAYPT